MQLSPHDVVRPDLSGWRRHRLPNPADMRPISIVPAWICEITSSSTASRDRVKKRALYAAHGVSHYWILDPEARTLEVLELEEGRWVELGGYDDESIARIPPFTDVELELGRLFLPASDDT